MSVDSSRFLRMRRSHKMGLRRQSKMAERFGTHHYNHVNYRSRNHHGGFSLMKQSGIVFIGMICLLIVAASSPAFGQTQVNQFGL